MSVYERYRQAYWGTRGALEKAEQSRQALLEHAEDRAQAERDRELNRALSAGEALTAMANDFEWRKRAKPEDVARLGELITENNGRVFALLGIQEEVPAFEMPDVVGMRWALRTREAHDRLAKMEHLDADQLEGVLSKEADAIIAEIGLDNLARIVNTAQQTRTLSEAAQGAMTPTGPPAEGPGGPRNAEQKPQPTAPPGLPAAQTVDPLAPGLTVKERVIATLRPYAPLPLVQEEQQPAPGSHGTWATARTPGAGYRLPKPVSPTEPAVPVVQPGVSGPSISTPPTVRPVAPPTAEAAGAGSPGSMEVTLAAAPSSGTAKVPGRRWAPGRRAPAGPEPGGPAGPGAPAAPGAGAAAGATAGARAGVAARHSRPWDYHTEARLPEDKRLLPWFVEECEKNHVDLALALAVGCWESKGFKPEAKSRKDARGIMQLMPKTAAWMGVTNPYDPQQSIRGGVKYLAYLLNKYAGQGDKKLDYALAAYNWGEGRVDELIAEGKDLSSAPEETRNYVPGIKNLKEKYEVLLGPKPEQPKQPTGGGGGKK